MLSPFFKEIYLLQQVIYTFRTDVNKNPPFLFLISGFETMKRILPKKVPEPANTQLLRKSQKALSLYKNKKIFIFLQIMQTEVVDKQYFL